MSSDRIIIIGAGMTGLSAARALRDTGRPVLLLEKGKSVGGRMATRRLKKGQADHGAQSFTAKNNKFVGLKNELLEEGVIREWYRGLPAPHEVANAGIYPRYCGAASMNAVAKKLAEGAEVKTGVEVTRITQSGFGWNVETKKEKFEAAAVILAAPVPQSIKLLENGEIKLDQQILDELQSLTYYSCITLMARFEKQIKLPAPGILHLHESIVEWISDNQQKGISDSPVVTLQCHYRYSSENIDEKDERLTSEILKSVKEYLPSEPVETQLQRWRYSKPKTVAAKPCLVVEEPAPLVFAGDTFVDGRLEGAYLSGLAAADSLIGFLESPRSKAEAS